MEIQDSTKPKKVGKVITVQQAIEKADTKTFVAHPIAPLQLTSKIFDLLQQCLTTKQVRKGINETLKLINKENVELVILAANANPLELLASLPLICEEKSIPYCFVPEAAGLGRACGIKRPIICCAVLKGSSSNINSQIDLLKDKIELLMYS